MNQAFKTFLKNNERELLKEYHAYGTNPNVDYCTGQCDHFHNFESYALNEFHIYLQEKERTR